ncbi:putative transketolase [Microstroma glucosiphilum]|uniref:transketolase n=1 Tax=Pseudomicrostroma glucosiphilum TaxID=1684307 RepID=A0A316TZX4_9BASI|nr:putative transketolase [Pseudomicrostroma glucosiphilum]PWN17803.1 putative transketolase [Pseudomicrostroma glucosiphilum]
MPIGMAPITQVLFSKFFKSSAKGHPWINRDRFVLSNGHGCALQYIIAHLLGYDLSMDDLKAFRQLDSKTPGHPEAGHHTPMVECTTGPLGQGISNAVGLAIAEANAAATFNKPGFELFNNKTYAFLGDGCLQEGISSEACSLAGHLKLGNLICIYDDNHISIDGDTACSFTEDVEQRYLAYDWHVISVNDGDKDFEGMYKALEEAQKVTDKPTLIRLKTTIGFGSLNQGGAATHGAPLKADDIAQLKKKFGLDPEQFFHVPQEVYDEYHKIQQRGAGYQKEWDSLFEQYKGKFPTEHAELARRISGKLPDGWEKALPVYSPSDSAVATRKLSETALSKLAAALPELLGGSADLTGSNLTRWSDAVDFQNPTSKLGDYSGRYIRYGVREHAMGAIMNGLHAYGLHIPTSGTFLNFVSYAIGAVRLSALSNFRVIWVATHDSIGLGEDGPTHQPVETGMALRAIPNLNFMRPADGNEVSAMYKVAIEAIKTPSVIALSRQNLPQLEGSTIEKASKGGYVLKEVQNADITLVATGSEVAIARDAAAELEKKGIKARLVSLPCFKVFDDQSLEYRKSVLPSGAPILSVEAYTTLGWHKYAHVQHGLNTFGASAPAPQVYKKFKLEPVPIAEKAEKVIDYYKKQGTPLVSPIELAAAFE